MLPFIAELIFLQVLVLISRTMHWGRYWMRGFESHVPNRVRAEQSMHGCTQCIILCLFGCEQVQSASCSVFHGDEKFLSVSLKILRCNADPIPKTHYTTSSLSTSPFWCLTKLVWSIPHLLLLKKVGCNRPLPADARLMLGPISKTQSTVIFDPNRCEFTLWIACLRYDTSEASPSF